MFIIFARAHASWHEPELSWLKKKADFVIIQARDNSSWFRVGKSPTVSRGRTPSGFPRLPSWSTGIGGMTPFRSEEFRTGTRLDWYLVREATVWLGGGAQESTHPCPSPPPSVCVVSDGFIKFLRDVRSEREPRHSRTGSLHHGTQALPFHAAPGRIGHNELPHLPMTDEEIRQNVRKHTGKPGDRTNPRPYPKTTRSRLSPTCKVCLLSQTNRLYFLPCSQCREKKLARSSPLPPGGKPSMLYLSLLAHGHRRSSCQRSASGPLTSKPAERLVHGPITLVRPHPITSPVPEPGITPRSRETLSPIRCFPDLVHPRQLGCKKTPASYHVAPK